MGLDMYLYKSKKGQFAARKRYYEAMNAHWKKWQPKLKDLPRKSNGWQIDESKLTEQQIKDMEQEEKERNGVSSSMNYKEGSGREEEISYWRKFNALHGYIVKTFANGEDTCQTIEIKENGSYKEGVKRIVDALDKTKKKLDSGETTNLEMMPQEGFFFGSTEIDDWFKTDVKEALDFFRDLYDKLEDDDVIFYEASW